MPSLSSTNMLSSRNIVETANNSKNKWSTTARSTYGKKKMMTTGSLNNSSQKQSSNDEISHHRLMSEPELNQFRTRLCPNIAKHGKCPDGDACMDSHCKAFQRRDPSVVQYHVQLCPRISFISTVDANGRKKMSLVNKCPFGKQCRFSHTQEERLYHPDTYKTQSCRGFPKCKPFCPFAHGKDELRKTVEKEVSISVMDDVNCIEKNRSKLIPLSPPLSVTSTMAPSPLLLPETMLGDTRRHEDEKAFHKTMLPMVLTSPLLEQRDQYLTACCEPKKMYLPPGFALDDISSSDEEDDGADEDLLLFVLD